MTRFLVVANQTLCSDELVAAMVERATAGRSEVWVVAPATPVSELAGRSVPLTPMPVMGGVLAVPGSPEEARRLAEDKLSSALEKLAEAGVKADGEVGDPDPVCAVRDAVRHREFDEIVVSTLPARFSRWLGQDLPRRLEQRFDLPVVHVEAAQVSTR